MQKKSEVFKKHNFLGQALDWGNQVSMYHVWIFSAFNIMNRQVVDKTCLNLSKSWYLYPNLETLVETIPR